ncbi:hypothetical protein BS47DRAFT_1353187, partial [Hydnum rufescens UP504]
MSQIQSVTSHIFPSRAWKSHGTILQRRRGIWSLSMPSKPVSQPSKVYDRVHRLCGPCQDG